MRLILIACVSILLVGCRAVLTTRPIGEIPKDIQNAKCEWEGTWMNPSGGEDNLGFDALNIKVVDGSNGILRAYWLEEGTNDLMKSKSVDVYLRGSNDWTFATIMSEDDAKEGTNAAQHVWGRILKRERTIILWAPNSEKFEDLVKKGKLPGSISKGNVVLGNLTSNDLAIITSETNGVLFFWDAPLVLFKASK